MGLIYIQEAYSKFSARCGWRAIYDDLFERRQEGDYADFVRFQAEQVRPWLPQTEAFIAHIASLLSPEQPPEAEPS